MGGLVLRGTVATSGVSRNRCGILQRLYVEFSLPSEAGRISTAYFPARCRMPLVANISVVVYRERD